jgi:pyruvate kinase
MALSFGVVPSFLELKKNRMRIQRAAIESLISNRIVNPEDMLIYVGGRFGEEHSASFIEVATAANMVNSTVSVSINEGQ